MHHPPMRQAAKGSIKIKIKEIITIVVIKTSLISQQTSGQELVTQLKKRFLPCVHIAAG